MAAVENTDMSSISKACTWSLVSFLCCFTFTFLKKIQKLAKNSKYAEKHNYMSSKVYHNRNFYKYIIIVI